MDLKLKDKVVLINGAPGGIGQALCRRFAAEGCKLAISSTSQAKLDAFVPTLGLGPDRIKTFVCDVTVEEQVKAFVDGAVAAYGQERVELKVIPGAGHGFGGAALETAVETVCAFLEARTYEGGQP